MTITPKAVGGTASLGPIVSAAAVVKSDSTIVNCRALYVGGAGDVAVLLQNDESAVTLSAVPAGALLPLACTKVMSTNTTATLIVALY